MEKPKISVNPDAWASKVMCIGPNYGKVIYDRMPIQNLQLGFYSHEKLYSEKTLIGLMKAAYYDGYTAKQDEERCSET